MVDDNKNFNMIKIIVKTKLNETFPLLELIVVVLFVKLVVSLDEVVDLVETVEYIDSAVFESLEFKNIESVTLENAELFSPPY